MEVKGIFFNRVLTVQEILKKWGITERRLFQIADKNDFPFFIFIKKHHKPSTKEDLLLCEGPFYTYFRNGMYHIIHSKIENIVFDPQDIELFEHEHPEILRKADEMQKNLESENDHLKARITELETELAACREQLEEARREISGREELPPKAKKSYLTIIAALCNKRQPLDITSSSAVSVLKTEIEKIGLTLGEDTIRKIIKEVRDIVAS